MGGFLNQKLNRSQGRPSNATNHAPWMIDTIMVLGLWVAVLEFNPWTPHVFRSVLILAAFASVLQLAIAVSRGRYVEVPRPSRTDEVASTIIATSVAAASIPLVAEVLNRNAGAREILLGALVIIPVLGITGEVRRSRRRSRMLEPVIIVGTGLEAREIAGLLTDHPETGIRLVGVVGDRKTAERHDLGAMWIGDTDEVVPTMEKYGTSTAIISPNSYRAKQFRVVVDSLLENGFDVALSSGITRIGVKRHMMTDIVHEPLLLLQSGTVHSWHHKAKRAVDVVGSAVGLVIASPVLVLAAIAIKVHDRGPVLYLQKRVGLNGQEFKMRKLRTMKIGADQEQAALEAENERNGPLFKMSHDRRITPIGRLLRELSIDELPQLSNVFKGDMSLVGPRPALKSEVDKFDRELQDRSKVRPGLTGLWQVEARTNASFSAYRRLDLHYIENWSFWLDVRIIMATVQLVVVSLALKIARTLLRRTDPAVDAVESSISLAEFQVPEPIDEFDDIDETTVDAPAYNPAG